MIIYYNPIPENFFNSILENEIIETENKFTTFNFYKQNLLLYMQKIADSIEALQDIDNTQILFNMLSEIKILLEKMHYIESLLNSNIAFLKNIQFSDADLETKVENYNFNFKDYINKFNSFISEFETFIQTFLDNMDFYFINSVNTNDSSTINQPESCTNDNSGKKITEEEVSYEQTTTEIPTPLCDNNCLIISEKKRLVYLPYKIKDLEDILSKSNKYKDINDLIIKEYILSLSRFKNPILSRFKEAFHLMKVKEKSSFLEAFSFALELSFNSTLNPAVIAACRNKDELDIYLDCLEEKELDQFNIFEIKYEINPTIK